MNTFFEKTKLNFTIFNTLIAWSLFLLPISLFSQVAFDNASGPVWTSTFSYTVSGTNTFLIVSTETGYPASDDVTGITYNGVAMTRLLTNARQRQDFLYYLVGPATGTHDIVISLNRTIDSQTTTVTSYNGVKQQTPPQYNACVAQTCAVTTTTNNAWLVGTSFSNAVYTQPSGQTARTATTCSQQNIDKGPITPAGSASLGMVGSSNWPLLYTLVLEPAPATYPTLTTQAVTNIAGTTATGNGNVTADGGATITERGVCWNTSTVPTTANNKAISSGTTGAFTSAITALSVNTLYYVRAYAINSAGISYGNEVTFTTFNIPSVTTQAVSNIAATTATGNGNVTANGGLSITERGVCWNTSATPTTANSKATSAGTTGAFTASMTGLSVGTLYYVRAYAINAAGISYGNEVTFTTLNLASITTLAVTSITATTAIGNGNVSADGGATITERGVCWNTSTAPTTGNNKATSAGTTGAFTASITGLTAGTLYYVRAYAVNSVGISYGIEVTFTTPTPAIVDWNKSNVQEITLATNRSFIFTNGKNGGNYTFIIKQNGSGGKAVSWPTNIKWSGITTPSLTTTPNETNIFKFVFDGVNYLETGRSLNIN
ncbi:MAG: hypothetical protein HGB12_00025 [Bacteroidetes bacterium]|nr:hypothetical protein [Bacteroidota bacterium]